MTGNRCKETTDRTCVSIFQHLRAIVKVIRNCACVHVMIVFSLFVKKIV